MIPLLNTKVVNNSNIKEGENFEVVDVSKINVKKVIKEYREKRVTKLIKMICANNKKLLEIKIEITKLENIQKQKEELKRRREEAREIKRRNEEER